MRNQLAEPVVERKPQFQPLSKANGLKLVFVALMVHVFAKYGAYSSLETGNSPGACFGVLAAVEASVAAVLASTGAGVAFCTFV